MKLTKKIVKFCLFALVLALPLSVFAAANQVSQSVIVGEKEIIDGNFIKVGNVIDIAGAVKGDVIVAGNSITITGPVAGDVIVAGNSIKISGPVEGSVRAVGSTIEIAGEVKHNVWAAGSSVTLAKDSSVGWDVYAAAGNVSAKGKIGGNLWAGAGTILITNQVAKNVTASVDRQGQVILEAEAKIGGDLTYQAATKEQLVIKAGAVVSGQTIQKELAKGHEIKTGFFSLAFFLGKTIAFFALLVVGLVLLTLIPKKLLTVRDEMIKRPWPSIGWGLVYLVVTPMVVILLLFTVIGIPLALIILPLYLVGIYISKVIAGLAIGIFVIDKLTKNKYRGSLIWPLALGLLILVIINSLPIFGWLIGLVATLWAFGAVIQIKKDIIAEWR